MSKIKNNISSENQYYPGNSVVRADDLPPQPGDTTRRLSKGTPKAVGSLVTAAQYNTCLAYLRTAAAKYYPGFAIIGDVGVGAIATAQQMNDEAWQCQEVTNRSPLAYTYQYVSVGALMQEAPLVTNTNQIYQVSICYANCHSDCHSDCYSDCDCQSCDPNGGN